MHARYLAVLILLVIGPTFTSAAQFLIAPETAYYRPWEYFEEIGYKVKGKPLTWQGVETGDLSRTSILFKQDARETRVTTTPNGFRSVPHGYGPAQVLFLGDSLTFGSGLSDDETLPWRVADLASIGTYNGARLGGLDCLLGQPRLANVKLVVEVATERFVTADEVKKRTTCTNAGGQLEREADPLWFRDVPPQRYLYPSRLLRAAKGLLNDLKGLAKSRSFDALEKPDLHGDPVSDAELDLAVAEIAKIKEKLASQGLSYVYLAVPSSRTIYGKWIAGDAGMADFHPRLISKLQAAGVQTFNVEQVFRQAIASGSPYLYQPHDTHWAPEGADVLAHEIAKRLKAGSLALPAKAAAVD